jgi:septal ring factor EnvC (AmiA/AmiB activator)
MAVRTRLSWPWRIVALLGLVALIAAVWWVLGAVDRIEVEGRVAAAQRESSQLRTEIAELRKERSQLETELTMVRGSQAAFTHQALDLQKENSQLKEDLSFLQKVVADSASQSGVSIQRLAATLNQGDEVHFSMLVVRGTGATADFEGKLKLQATLMQPAVDQETAVKPMTLNLPDDEPSTASALDLRFKYYQRVEGSFRVPSGASLRSLTARAFEAGQAKPRATQNVSF